MYKLKGKVCLKQYFIFFVCLVYKYTHSNLFKKILFFYFFKFFVRISISMYSINVNYYSVWLITVYVQRLQIVELSLLEVRCNCFSDSNIYWCWLRSIWRGVGLMIVQQLLSVSAERKGSQWEKSSTTGSLKTDWHFR